MILRESKQCFPSKLLTGGIESIGCYFPVGGSREVDHFRGAWERWYSWRDVGVEGDPIVGGADLERELGITRYGGGERLLQESVRQTLLQSQPRSREVEFSTFCSEVSVSIVLYIYVYNES